MGASVGVGGMIIGISMLVVFSMAYQSLSAQIDLGIERIDDQMEPIPTFSIDDAIVWDGAIVGVSITNGGAGYNGNGNLVLSSDTNVVVGTYTVTAGNVVDSVTITNPGDYSAAPGIEITGDTGAQGTTATFSTSIGNYIYANLTNTGSTTISFENMWFTFDGEDPHQMSTIHTEMLNDDIVDYDRSTISSIKWYPGETLFLQWSDASASATTRISLTVGPTSKGVNFA